MPLETTRFDILDHLKTPEDRVAYIEAALRMVTLRSSLTPSAM